jgi:hypothetical protein
MLSRRHSTLILAALFLTACSDVSLPQRGFATRYFQSNVAPEFTAAPDGIVAPATTPESLDSCEQIARERATGAADQGFSEDVQRSVYDEAVRDCQTWRQRLGHSSN